MKLIICGDMSVTEESHKYFENEDVTKAFSDVTEVFKTADRVIVNLECALTESEQMIKKFGVCLKAPLNTAKTLKNAGVTECALSNNHIFDFGIKGLSDTLINLDKNGIKWFGIGDNYEDSRKDYIIEHDGLIISLINVCEHEYSYATEDRIGTRPFDEFETMYDIRKAKEKSDYVIVIYHGGKEHCRYPSPRLRKACREMVHSGADVVLCQHSHCIGCYENFENAHILYGQGNFHFVKSEQEDFWNEGLIAEINIIRESLDVSFIPVVAENGGIKLAEEKTNRRILSELKERSETLETNEWKKRWHNYCTTVAKTYRYAISGYSTDDPADKTQLFAHYLDCEAHTDVWRELFPTWNMTNEIKE